MKRCMLNLTHKEIIPHVGTIYAWQMRYQLAFSWKTCCLIKGTNVYLSGTKQPCGFQLWVLPCWVFACTCVILHKTQTYEENLQSCSWETLNKNPPLIYISPKPRDRTLPEESFSLVQANYFFKLLSITSYDVSIFHDSEIIQAQNIKNIHCIPSWKKKR